MSVLQRLSGCLAQTLRLSSRQYAALQQQAAFHLSTTLEARRKRRKDDSDSDSDAEDAGRNPADSEAEYRSSGDLINDRRANAAHAGSTGPESSSDTDGGPPVIPSEVAYEEVKQGEAQWDIQTLISPALAAALDAAPEDPEEADKLFEELAIAAEKVEKGEELPGDEPASYDDLRTLAEAIDLYFKAAPEPDPEVDTWEEFDRDTLKILSDTIKQVVDGGARNTTVNTAPPGRLPWEILDVDEETPMINWGVDLTEGRAADPWKNALLSEETKEEIYRLHKEEGWDAATLAETFQIRQQRVMAIIALKEQEHEAREAGLPLCDAMAEAYDDEMGAFETMGSGERHHVVLPSYPNLKELTEADAERLAAFLEERLGKPFDQIEAEDMTDEVTRELLAKAGIDKHAVEEELAMKEEEQLVAEFRRSLEYNLGKSGVSLSRASRKTHPPKRPQEGWSLLVQPLGKAARSGERQAYVALPDGSKRELTADEKLKLERQQPRARSKIL